MTEINGKKYYTWQEILAMPLGTKFTHASWYPRGAAYLFRKELTGTICLAAPWSEEQHALLTLCFLSMQDRLELIEDKPEDKSECKYVDGFEALRKITSGEWKCVACESFDGKFRSLSDFFSLHFNISSSYVEWSSHVENSLLLKKWYEYKG